MIKSMTGYGRAETLIQGIKFLIEIKAVNHKFLDIILKMPKDFMLIEEDMKKLIKTYLKRGRIEVYISFDVEENPLQQLKVDWHLLNQYLNIFKEFADRLNVGNNIGVSDLLAIPDIIHVGHEKLDVEAIKPEFLEALKFACDNLGQMRVNEGNYLYNELVSRIHTISKILQDISKRAPEVIEDYRQKLLLRITEWLQEKIEVDEGRLLNEVAFFTDKANIDEEITRLQSHLQQYLSILNQDEPVGRKLDFIIQEMNREINTIGSKANDLKLSQMVIEIKSELEKLREQVQNVE